MLKVEDNCVISIISSMCWLDAFFGVNTSYIHLFTYMKFLKYNTVLGKLAGRIGTLRGPDLALGPVFGDRCYKTTRSSQRMKLSSKTG